MLYKIPKNLIKKNFFILETMALSLMLIKKLQMKFLCVMFVAKIEKLPRITHIVLYMFYDD